MAQTQPSSTPKIPFVLLCCLKSFARTSPRLAPSHSDSPRIPIPICNGPGDGYRTGPSGRAFTMQSRGFSGLHRGFSAT